MYGGSFMYHMDPDMILLGFVVGLNYHNPYVNPYKCARDGGAKLLVCFAQRGVTVVPAQRVSAVQAPPVD